MNTCTCRCMHWKWFLTSGHTSKPWHPSELTTTARFISAVATYAVATNMHMVWIQIFLIRSQPPPPPTPPSLPNIILSYFHFKHIFKASFKAQKTSAEPIWSCRMCVLGFHGGGVRSLMVDESGAVLIDKPALLELKTKTKRSTNP